LAWFWAKGKAWRGFGQKARLGVVLGTRQGLAWFWAKGKAWRGFGQKARLGMVWGENY
jgi:hypothetical protein